MTVEELSKGIAELIVLKGKYGALKESSVPNSVVVNFQSDLKNLLATTSINDEIKHHLLLLKKSPTAKELIQVSDAAKLELDALLIKTIKKEPPQNLEKKTVDASGLTKIQEMTNAIQAFLLLKAKVQVRHDDKEKMKTEKLYDQFKTNFQTTLQNLITQYQLAQALNTAQKKRLAQKNPIPTVKELMSILDSAQDKLEASISKISLSVATKQNDGPPVVPPTAAAPKKADGKAPSVQATSSADHLDADPEEEVVAAAPTDTDGEVPPVQATSSADPLDTDHEEIVTEPRDATPVAAAAPIDTDGGAHPVQATSSADPLDADHEEVVTEPRDATPVAAAPTDTDGEVPPVQATSSADPLDADHEEVVTEPRDATPVAAAAPTDTDGEAHPVQATSSADPLDADHEEVVTEPRDTTPVVAAAAPTKADAEAPSVQATSSPDPLDAAHEEKNITNSNTQFHIDREKTVKQLDELLKKLEAQNNLLSAQKFQYFQSSRAKRDYTEAETAGKNLLSRLREHRHSFVVTQTTDLAQFKEACESALDTDTIAKLEKQPGYTNLIQKIKFWVASIFTLGIVPTVSYFKTGSAFGFFAPEAKPAGIVANDIKTNVSAMIMG